MNAADDLELRLRDWMTATSATSTSVAPVERALTAIDHVRQRPAIAVRTGMGSRPNTWAGWSVLRVGLVAVLAAALIGTALLVASQQLEDVRPRPSQLRPTPSVPVAPSEAAVKLTLRDSFTFGMFDPFGPGLNGRVAVQDPALGRLADGRALVLGGDSTRNGSLESLGAAGIYKPLSGKLQAVGPMQVARAGATLVLLADGRVLVLGGYHIVFGASEWVADAEILDPSSGVFTSIDPILSGADPCECGSGLQVLIEVRATLMGDGRVLIAGERYGSATGPSSADILNPDTGSFVRVPIGCDAARGTQTALADGRVLIICFESTSTGDATTARIFDPNTNAFGEPAQPAGGTVGLATLLSDGRVLLTGRAANDDTAHAELFDPSTDSWTRLDSPVNPSADVAVTLSDGRVAFLLRDPGVFDPSTNLFATGPTIPKAGIKTVLALGRDRILVHVGAELLVFEFEADR